MYSFNLLDEKWLPCIMHDGSYAEKGLLDALFQAGEIREIFAPSPIVTVSLHRLLLVILHRSFETGYGPADNEEWGSLWQEGIFNRTDIERYAQQYHSRFDLFDEDHPFYQYAALGNSIPAEPLSVNNLLHESAIYLNKATLFDHDIEKNVDRLSPTEAARFLVTFQNFAVGGFSGLSKPRLKGEESAKAGPLLKGAIIIAQGKNLFETLMLNMVVFSPEESEPFEGEAEDKPAWEMEGEIHPGNHIPSGYLNLLTWQSRRVKLIPHENGSGTCVTEVAVRKGNELPDYFSLQGRDPMMAFYRGLKPAKGEDPWPAFTLKEDRAAWRDSSSLLQTVPEITVRPRIYDHLAELAWLGILPRTAIYGCSVFGLVTNQATIALWRHERFPLPLEYLHNENLMDALKEGLDLAERAGRLLSPGYVEIEIKTKNKERKTSVPAPLMVLASELLPKDQNGRTDPGETRKLAASLSPSGSYFAALGTMFNTFLVNLSSDLNPDGSTFGDKALPAWAKEIRGAARNAFNETVNDLDRTGRSLKAVSRAEHDFNSHISRLMKEYLNADKEGGE